LREEEEAVLRQQEHERLLSTSSVHEQPFLFLADELVLKIFSHLEVPQYLVAASAVNKKCVILLNSSEKSKQGQISINRRRGRVVEGTVRAEMGENTGEPIVLSQELRRLEGDIQDQVRLGGRRTEKTRPDCKPGNM